ncbi:MAG: Ig-like domain-containing protein [Spirochaetales bacterium]|nr:Ig-like domain-containing protein [Spirochaetales bacterium]
MRVKIANKIGIFFIIGFFFIFSLQCSQVDIFPQLTTDNIPPSIESYSPGNNATGVSISSIVKVVFSEEMDKESTNFAFKLYKQTLTGEELVVGTITWQNEGKTLIFTPNIIPGNPGQRLKVITEYRISVSTAAKDKNTNQLEKEGSSTFRTIGNILLTAGYRNSLVLKNDGSAWSWGGNDEGQAGQGPEALSIIHTPGQVLALENITTVCAGENHLLAINSNGEIFTWGYYADNVLGYTIGNSQSIPVKVDNIINVVTGCVGSQHTVVVVEEDDTTHVYTWGALSYGRLGNGIRDGVGSTYVPQLVLIGPDEPLIDIIAVASGRYFTIALDTSGNLWGWGSNDVRQLGRTDIADYIEYAVPLNIGVTEKSTKIIASRYHSSTLLENGQIVSWGANDYGQLGSNQSSDLPFYPPEYVKKIDGTVLTNVIDIASSCRTNSALALCEDGTVWAWGYNNNAQLGIGNKDTKIYAIQVPNLSSITGIAIGTNHGLAVNSDGEVFGWGWNFYGATGINDELRDFLLTPEKVFDCSSKK